LDILAREFLFPDADSGQPCSTAQQHSSTGSAKQGTGLKQSQFGTGCQGGAGWGAIPITLVRIHFSYRALFPITLIRIGNTLEAFPKKHFFPTPIP
jgi:hypothetical protein